MKSNVFKKIDLHIHTPQSLCYSDKSVTPEEVVDTALRCGLDAIAITDHNTISAIEDIRRAAENKSLTVFPGIELSTSGGHVIGLFDIHVKVSQLEIFLRLLGIFSDAMGDGARISEYPMESVFQTIHQQGGLAIAAHIERWPSGFLETNLSRQLKIAIHGSPYLSALEITIPQNKEKWNFGKMRGYPKKHACIQSSDAHALDEIGRRPVSIRMDEINLACLKAAFADYENRIFFEGS